MLAHTRELWSQVPDASTGLLGTVYDSTAMAPLRGAMLHARRAEDVTRAYTAVTDAYGAFHVSGVPPGEYFVRLTHQRLETMGIRLAEQSVRVGARTSTRVDFVVPSLSRIRADRCGTKAELASGIALGRLITAVDAQGVPMARVTATWQDVPGAQRPTRAHVQKAIIDATTGVYALCDLPVNVAVVLAASAPGRASVQGPVKIPESGLLVKSLLLADTLAEHGPARIRGQVLMSDDRPLAAGKATIASLRREVNILAGQFVIADLPLGTWTVSVRAIGMEPLDVLVSTEQLDTDVGSLRLTPAAQAIDAVHVLASRSASDALLGEIRRRQRAGFGTVFLPEHPALASAVHTADVLREARGFYYRDPTTIQARERIRSGRSSRCDEIAVYVNGTILPGGFADLDLVAPAREVLAVEAYPDVLFAPLQYRSNVGVDYQRAKARRESSTGVCAVVLVWTRYRLPGGASPPPSK